MNITLNGEKRAVPDNVSVLGLLEFLAIQHQRVAVELNEMIVKKDRYAETVVNEGDSLEVVAFMGGGSGRQAIHTGGVMEKEAFLKHWASIRKNQQLKPKPVRYTHEGSTYAEDGIRLTGSRVFIDSVLSRLKDLLDHECDETRLQVVYQRSADRESGRQLKSWNCYIQVHQRGAVKKEGKGKEKKK